MKIKYILQLEGAAIFALALFIYAQFDGSWWLFAALILAPDLSMIGYALGLKVGTFCYNLVHIYILPAVLAAAGIYFDNPLLIHISIIWFAHIGMDKMVGYGLKYVTGFKDTHFTRL